MARLVDKVKKHSLLLLSVIIYLGAVFWLITSSIERFYVSTAAGTTLFLFYMTDCSSARKEAKAVVLNILSWFFLILTSIMLYGSTAVFVPLNGIRFSFVVIVLTAVFDIVRVSSKKLAPQAASLVKIMRNIVILLMLLSFLDSLNFCDTIPCTTLGPHIGGCVLASDYLVVQDDCFNESFTAEDYSSCLENETNKMVCYEKIMNCDCAYWNGSIVKCSEVIGERVILTEKKPRDMLDQHAGYLSIITCFTYCNRGVWTLLWLDSILRKRTRINFPLLFSRILLLCLCLNHCR